MDRRCVDRFRSVGRCLVVQSVTWPHRFWARFMMTRPWMIRLWLDQFWKYGFYCWCDIFWFVCQFVNGFCKGFESPEIAFFFSRLFHLFTRILKQKKKKNECGWDQKDSNLQPPNPWGFDALPVAPWPRLSLLQYINKGTPHSNLYERTDKSYNSFMGGHLPEKRASPSKTFLTYHHARFKTGMQKQKTLSTTSHEKSRRVANIWET